MLTSNQYDQSRLANEEEQSVRANERRYRQQMQNQWAADEAAGQQQDATLRSQMEQARSAALAQSRQTQQAQQHDIYNQSRGTPAFATDTAANQEQGQQRLRDILATRAPQQEQDQNQKELRDRILTAPTSKDRSALEKMLGTYERDLRQQTGREDLQKMREMGRKPTSPRRTDAEILALERKRMVQKQELTPAKVEKTPEQIAEDAEARRRGYLAANPQKPMSKEARETMTSWALPFKAPLEKAMADRAELKKKLGEKRAMNALEPPKKEKMTPKEEAAKHLDAIGQFDEFAKRVESGNIDFSDPDTGTIFKALKVDITHPDTQVVLQAIEDKKAEIQGRIDRLSKAEHIFDKPEKQPKGPDILDQLTEYAAETGDFTAISSGAKNSPEFLLWQQQKGYAQ